MTRRRAIEFFCSVTLNTCPYLKFDLTNRGSGAAISSIQHAVVGVCCPFTVDRFHRHFEALPTYQKKFCNSAVKHFMSFTTRKNML